MDPQSPTPDGGQGGLLPYEALVRLVRRNRLLLVVSVGLALIGGALYQRLAVPRYTSSVRLYIEATSPKLLKDADASRAEKNYLYTQATIAVSTTVLEKAVERIGQAETTPWAETLRQRPNPVGYLDGCLSAEVSKKDDILILTCTCGDPQEAAGVVQAVTDAYIAYNEEKMRNTSSRILQILHEEKEATGRELMDKLRELTEFKQQHKEILFGSPGEDFAANRLTRLADALTESNLEVVEAHAHFKTIEGLAADPAQLRQYVRSRNLEEPVFSGVSESAMLRSQVNSLQLQLEKLLRVLTPEHPSVKAMEDKIATTFGQLEAVEREYARAQTTLAYQQYTAAVQKQQQVQSQYESQRRRTIEVNEQQAQYVLLESEWQQAKKMSDLLDERIREVDVTENAGSLNIHVVESAQVPSRPAHPDPKRVMAIALLLGAALGAGGALVRDFTDQRFSCSREVRAILDVPVLAVIPQLPSSLAAELVSYTHPDSSVARSFRRLTSFVFYGPGRETNRIFHLASARDGDGKTMAVCNLAVAMAHAGQRTLLIDCHFTSPRLRMVFDLPEMQGIAEVLQKRCALPQVLGPTCIPRLDVLQGGRFRGNPIAVFNHPQFQSMLRILRCQYDRILIDSQGILDLPESLVLSHLADVTLLVLHGERSRQSDALQIRREHETLGAVLGGVIVNRVRLRGSSYQHQQTWQRGESIARLVSPFEPSEQEEFPEPVYPL